jgi:two-component sensor histidine kinase
MLDTPTPRVPDDLFSEVFITEEMLARPIGTADFHREKLAIQELAARMLDAPSDVLPRFIELAMEMLDGCSAGLSLLEGASVPGRFRWHQLRGSLAKFEGATTPRNYSPCGITLDRAAPVLTRHSERAYSWISDENIILPEVLLVPLYIGGSEPLGTLWIVSNVPGHFTSEHSRVATELATFVGIALHMQRTEARLRQALEAQETLTHEMNHRVKNLFALTNAMIRQSVKGSATKEEMAEALSGRLAALASAHSFVLRNAALTDETIDLRELIAAVVKPHDDARTTHKPRIVMKGPSLACNEKNASAIALVFNELATNAVKYGSLSGALGSVDITWTVKDNAVHFLWKEHGGPSVEPPTRVGFGSRLVELTVAHQLAGSVAYDWRPDGLAASVSLPPSAFTVS